MYSISGVSDHGFRFHLKMNTNYPTKWSMVLPRKLINNHSDSEEIRRLLWNPKVYYCVHNSPAPVRILSPMNPVHTFSLYLPKTYSIIILPSTPRFPSGLFPSVFRPKLCMHLSFPYVLHVPLLFDLITLIFGKAYRIIRHKCKGKGVPVVNHVPCHEDVLRSERMNLGTRLMCVVSLTPRPFYPWYPFDMRLDESQRRSRSDGYENKSQPPPGVESHSSRPLPSHQDYHNTSLAHCAPSCRMLAHPSVLLLGNANVEREYQNISQTVI
jgi:hypothetical protein